MFYHVYQYGDWSLLFDEQFGLLKSSGLFNVADHIHIGINGMMLPQIEKVHAEINPNQHMEESDTLKSLLAYANENDAKILYMHTKGVSRPSPEATDWRHMMEYFCIEKWEECVDLLDEHDAVGCNFMDECDYGFYPHFSGNFWWATSRHIRRLDSSYLDADLRVMREFWIGSKGNSFYEIHNSKLDNHNYQRYLPERYRDE